MAMVLTAFIPRAIRLLEDMVNDEVAQLLGIADETRTMANKLETLKDIVHNAECENQEIRALSQWLNNTRDLMYDVDDIIDQCRHEGEKRRRILEQQARSFRLGFIAKSNLSLLSCFAKVAFRHKIGDRLKSLTLRLAKTVEDAPKFQLSEERGTEGLIQTYISAVMESHIVGTQTEDSAKGIIEVLTKGKHTFVVVTGTGGIGKTTLARRVYDDERTKAHFRTRAWISVTQQLSETEILKRIASGIGESYGESVTNKKFLLVLDGVCSHHFSAGLLQSATRGGRILITARNEAVTEGLNDVYRHRMKHLPTRDAWALLCRMVFREDQGRQIQELTDIGLKIARRCKGLPLAVNIVAGVLRNRRPVPEEWEKVYLDPAWTTADVPNDVTRVLYLGFRDLPSNLKQCFVYCSLFPEEHVFEQTFVIQFWIAEGLVEDDGDHTLEDTAGAYYKELICRNLLCPKPGIRRRCKMHSLLRFLTHYVAGEENIFGNLSLLETAPMRPRRLSLAARGLRTVPAEISAQDTLRTLLLFRNPLVRIDGLFENLCRLRVLDVHGTDIQSLPSSIGSLVHLRHLDVSETRLRQLPEAVQCLENLQFLIVRDCKRLRKLPRHLLRLQSLRRLDLVGTKVNRFPLGIGKLRTLNFLSGFTVDDEGTEGCRLEELQSLSQLRYLLIEKLERTPNCDEAAKARLKSKQHLKSLVLAWSRGTTEGARAVEVLEALGPPKGLELLEIRRFPGPDLPTWLSSHSSSLNNLKSIVLQHCPSIRRLPRLGHLPQLCQLYILGAEAVTTVGNELLGFPKLNKLVIEDMPRWREWRWRPEDDEAFPRLRELHLANCPKLKCLPEGLRCATTLTVLRINSVDRLTMVKGLWSVEELLVERCSGLVSVSGLSGVETVKIINCPSLKKIEGLCGLRRLHLVDDSVGSLPEGLEGGALKGLEWLEMECSKEMLRKCVKGGTEWPKLQMVSNVHVIVATDASKYLSYSRAPESYETSLKIDQISSVLVAADAPAVSVELKVIANSVTENSFRRNRKKTIHCSSRKLLVIIVMSVFVSVLLDKLFVSPVELFSLGVHFVSFLLILFSSL